MLRLTYPPASVAASALEALDAAVAGEDGEDGEMPPLEDLPPEVAEAPDEGAPDEGAPDEGAPDEGAPVEEATPVEEEPLDQAPDEALGLEEDTQDLGIEGSPPPDIFDQAEPGAGALLS